MCNRIQSVPLALTSWLQDPTAGGQRCRWQFPGSDLLPLKWSDLRYVSDIKEDSNAKEAIQA